MKIKFVHNLTFKIILSVVSVLAVLSIAVMIAGYYEFTDAIQDQYADSAFYTARTASDEVDAAFFSVNNYSLREWQLQYQTVKQEWQRLADTQDATYIYLFKASGENYQNVTFLVNIANSKARLGAYSAGYSIVQTDETYLKAFKEIYDNKSPRVEIAVYRRSDATQTGNHITVMIPVYSQRNNKGKILGIIGVEKEMTELDSARRSYINKVLAISSILLFITIVNYSMHLRKNLLRPIERITAETMRFAHENTKPQELLQSKITAQNEIGQLARNIDLMEEDIINYVENLTRVTQEKEQIKAELNIAAQIQLDMLPKDFIARKEFELYATMNPAKEVGGDFYDFFMVDDDHVALVMADVSGKGVPAALFMAISKALIKNRTQMGGSSPSEILRDVNNQLCEGNDADLFVTVWLGILEISTGKVICSNAGHEYPAIYRSGSGYELFVSKHSPAVATMEGMKFRENEFTLNPGDIFFIYTDGVAEATNINDELYGTDRMIKDLNMTQNKSAQEILLFMKQKVDEFTGEAPQFDDITMLCVKYFGGEKLS